MTLDELKVKVVTVATRMDGRTLTPPGDNTMHLCQPTLESHDNDVRLQPGVPITIWVTSFTLYLGNTLY